MIYYICLVFVVLLSYHSLGLVEFSSSSSSSSSSLFELFVRPICVVQYGMYRTVFILLVAYNSFLLRRYNRYLHSHIEDPVLYTVNYNTWQEGCRGDQREGQLHNTTQHTRYNVQHNTRKLFSPSRRLY